MNKVLLVGNGFDLAHGLLTKYEHFLYLIKYWNALYTEYKKTGSIVEANSKMLEFIQCMKKADIDRVERLNEIINHNSWIRYYSRCGAEIDGWIDFEKEIYPVIKLFEFIFDYEYVMRETTIRDVDVFIPKVGLDVKYVRIAELWDAYFYITNTYVYVKKEYVSRNYGILKKKVLENLRKEFEEFIESFEIYLHEFVYKNNGIKPLRQIKELNINSVISFNYTLTEKLYGITEDNVHHLHGMIREDLTQGKNNMVVGVNEADKQNMDFIYFVKYFQRIQKSSGTKYKGLIRKEYRTPNGLTGNAYELYIYGHSLDETDKDIITYVIGTKEELADDSMRPKHVTIFYYDPADYEQKVINLINLYGRDIVEMFIERNWFEFIPTSSEVIID